LIQPRVLSLSVSRVHTEVLAAGIFEDDRPLRGPAGEIDWIHNGLLSRLILDGKITGRRGEAILLATQKKIPASKVLIIGLGDRGGFDLAALGSALGVTCDKLVQLKVNRCVVEAFGLVRCRLETSGVVRVIASVLNASPLLKEIDLSFLIEDENKVQQLRQQFSAVSVTG
jgi:hypothetical protein